MVKLEGDKSIKAIRSYPILKNLCSKKRRGQKVQVTERPKDVISLWGQVHQLGCIII